jgi:hypothetical protein
VLGQDGFDGWIIQAAINWKDMCAWHAKNGFYPQAFHVSDNKFTDLYLLPILDKQALVRQDRIFSVCFATSGR